mmetsp:Transcript_26572/g.76801  ORF Transcript_26572/g.76801 Transcript_26572/m.76801 type:complete len:200 (-) Transcript_26572:286-885(-)
MPGSSVKRSSERPTCTSWGRRDTKVLSNSPMLKLLCAVSTSPSVSADNCHWIVIVLRPATTVSKRRVPSSSAASAASLRPTDTVIVFAGTPMLRANDSEVDVCREDWVFSQAPGDDSSSSASKLKPPWRPGTELSCCLDMASSKASPMSSTDVQLNFSGSSSMSIMPCGHWQRLSPAAALGPWPVGHSKHDSRLAPAGR